ncbi:MAG: LPS export ABC transporter periplasmic protein LptC [Firmicutes bacterium]|nr:LPS export ABC transporter periplasmic protein LptC [Bacillota bacterium]
MSRLRSLLPLAVVLLLLAAVLTLDTNEEYPTPSEDREEKITYFFSENTLIGRSQGRKTWEVKAERFQVDEAERYIYLSGAITGVIYRNGEESYWLSASRGVYNRKTQDLELTGGILITTKDEEKIQAAGLTYDHARDEVNFLPPVKVEVGRYTLEADRVVFKSNPERLLASGGVIIKSRSNEEIRCSELIYYRQDNTWEIKGAVEMSTDVNSSPGKE